MDAIAAGSRLKLETGQGTVRPRVSVAALATLPMAFLAVQQLLLWCFLGFSPAVVLAGALGLGALCVAFRRAGARGDQMRVDLRVVGLCFAVSLALFVLGGEGRFVYANADWQVRNAVLHDLVTNPWPFAYAVSGQEFLLRAPLGLYLIPALVGKAGGLRAAELTMLLQSAAFLTCILALASTLFETGRQRAWALLVFLAFSGMDLMGMALAGGNLGMHLEHWAGIQYSSHVTQAFWVPMHALAGWLGALLFLLWRTDRLPLAAFLAPMPLLALLSPLALIGVVPFAAYAGISTLWSRSLRRADILLPIAATALAIPSLIYLSAGSSAVGAKPNAVSFLQWLVFEAMETVPYLVAAVLAARSSRFGRLVPVLVALLLLALPFGAVSTGPDFTMRVSIASLAILSVLVAEIVTKHPATVGARLGRAVLVSVLVIGSATPLTEVEHVLSRPRQPLSTCSYFGVVPTGAPTYVAPRAAVSAAVAPSHPAIVTPHDPPSCLEVTWLEDERRYRNADFHWPSLF